MLKRIGIMLAAILLFCIEWSAALAEDGVNVEVIRADGVSVVVLTPEAVILRARSLAKGPADERRADLILPEYLTLIEESAFEGIAAKRVEITENVAAIERRAFADCMNLREIRIPATVLKVDDRALEGCENVTVYGVKGTEAERFAKAAGFPFVDLNEGPDHPIHPSEPVKPPVALPLVPRK